MKKVTLYLAIALGLSAFAFWIYQQNKKSGTFNSKEFSVSDTASVSKIFLADKKGNKVTLTRIKAGNWMVNDKFNVRNDAINVLLKTFKLIEIKNPIAKSMHNNIIKDMAARSVKVEIYTSDLDEPEKVYYVGGATQNTDGSFMLLQGSETPYVTYIPGFNGYLSTRYMVKEKEWRSAEIFNYSTISQVKSVSVDFVKAPAKSFKIDILNSNTFKLYSINPLKEVLSFDTLALKDYLTAWKFVNFEAFEVVSQSEKDSTIAIGPEYIFTMYKSDGSKKEIKAFLKRPSLYAPQLDNRPKTKDVDRMYGLLPNEKDFVLIQYYTFDKLILGLDYFVK